MATSFQMAGSDIVPNGDERAMGGGTPCFQVLRRALQRCAATTSPEFAGVRGHGKLPRVKLTCRIPLPLDFVQVD